MVKTALSLPEHTISAAKSYAAAHHTSLSALIDTALRELLLRDAARKAAEYERTQRDEEWEAEREMTMFS